jgi:transposase
MHPPATCPRCGARDSHERRYTTGGGWRTVHVCSVCGHRATPTGRRVAVGALLAGAVASIAILGRRRRRG